MNSDQLKNTLLSLEDDVEYFELVFSGKKSKKVNGLYKPESKEIVIHNKNFEDDNNLIYTGIHEFAHHLQFTRATKPISAKAHTVEFRSIFHALLIKAEAVGIYRNIFESDEELKALTQKIKSEFLEKNGIIMKEFGHTLMEAQKLCEKKSVRFEDYVSRVLTMDKSMAKSVVSVSALNLNPAVGFENMKILSRIKEPEKRKEAENEFLGGMSPDMIKQKYRKILPDKDEKTLLLEEKGRIERSLLKLNTKLDEIVEKLQDYPDW